MVTTVPTVVMELGKYDFLGLVLSVVVFFFMLLLLWLMVMCICLFTEKNVSKGTINILSM